MIIGSNGEEGVYYPSISLLRDKFAIRCSKDDQAVKSSTQNLLEQIKLNRMVPFYEQIYLKELALPPIDPSLLKKMNDDNQEIVQKIDEKLTEAESNMGETEVLDLLHQKALHFCQTGDKEKAIEALHVVMLKTSSIGTKIDCHFCIIRLAFVFEDIQLLENTLEKCNILIDEGGDWDRRNKMKIYKACHALLKRDFHSCATLLTSSLATFTYSGMLTFKEVVKYCAISALIKFTRKDLKEKVLNSPEVLEVLNDLPIFQQLLSSFYCCQYAEFFRSLAAIECEIRNDYFLYLHASYLVKEMKIAAYNQLLRSYKTISLPTVANAFEVTEEFIDEDLSKLIVAGRIPCTIDKVSNVIESKRTDSKNYLYQDIIKHGDLVLNRIQNLSRIVNA